LPSAGNTQSSDFVFADSIPTRAYCFEGAIDLIY
jgi:hypothetical protein